MFLIDVAPQFAILDAVTIWEWALNPRMLVENIVGPGRTIDVAFFDMVVQLFIAWESLGAELTGRMILNMAEKAIHTTSIVVSHANIQLRR